MISPDASRTSTQDSFPKRNTSRALFAGSADTAATGFSTTGTGAGVGAGGVAAGAGVGATDVPGAGGAADVTTASPPGAAAADIVASGTRLDGASSGITTGVESGCGTTGVKAAGATGVSATAEPAAGSSAVWNQSKYQPPTTASINNTAISAIGSADGRKAPSPLGSVPWALLMGDSSAGAATPLVCASDRIKGSGSSPSRRA